MNQLPLRIAISEMLVQKQRTTIQSADYNSARVAAVNWGKWITTTLPYTLLYPLFYYKLCHSVVVEKLDGKEWYRG